MSNIYFIGMRGVGKSSVGSLLAKRMKREFFDTDEWIKEKEDMAIADLVQKKGWEYFRKSERKAVEVMSKKENAVVSTGGGILMHFDNASKLKKTGKLIHLMASIKTLKKRLAKQTKRPSITGADPVDELESLWQTRKPIYDAYADITIDTEGKTAEAIVDELWTKS